MFAAFRELRDELGSIDRVIVNAGVGKGASLGTGYFDANCLTAQTNFVGALAQCEAGLELLRAQNAGHRVTIASVAAIRGMPRAQTVYAATKAGLSSLTEGIRADLWNSPIRISAIYPGYIQSEIGGPGVRKRPFIVNTETGCRALVRAIEREPARVYVPRWPWAPIAFLKRLVSLGLLVKAL